MAAPKKYPDELQARAVHLYGSTAPPPTFRQLDEQLGVHHETLRKLGSPGRGRRRKT